MEKVQIFQDKKVRTHWDAEREEWYFSVVDVVGVLTDSVDPSAYWRKLKQRLKAEGNETVTNCHGLKMQAPDGKMRLTDVADTKQLLLIIQSVPSPKAEPYKVVEFISFSINYPLKTDGVMNSGIKIAA